MITSSDAFRQQQLELYRSIMEEARTRVDAINVMLGGATGLAERAAAEFCYLQIRMLCELTALGCLVAHGEIEKTRTLNKIWAADEIVRRLERLNPTFYPKPVVFTNPSPGHWHLEEFPNENYLRQDEFGKLVGITGDILHKGSLRRLAKGQSSAECTIERAVHWGQKIVNLINQHRIGLIGNNHIVCALADGGGQVSVSFAQPQSTA
ncbi:hypothetical protein [Bradyrhizobium sp. AZCC 2289]|uniref:hypothetical protein n=1 Tax=Bradyrhizobium sp. AZCC 2289 TaxID=3117026 RepID=UPI002FF2AAF2